MKKILMVIAFIGMFGFGACSASIVSAEQNNPIKIWPENENGDYHVSRVVDETTGVNYIVVSIERNAYSWSVSITPRLNADGSLYVTE